MTQSIEGRGMVRLSWMLTGAFSVTALLAAWRPDAFQWPAAVVALVLFAVGTVAMLWAFFVAVNRSRVELIGVGGLYFGAGSAPSAIRRHLLGATVVQVVVGLTTASIRPFTSLAFGTLVPICGLGLMGLWVARYGTFPRRDVDTQRPLVDPAREGETDASS